METTVLSNRTSNLRWTTSSSRVARRMTALVTPTTNVNSKYVIRKTSGQASNNKSKQRLNSWTSLDRRIRSMAPFLMIPLSTPSLKWKTWRIKSNNWVVNSTIWRSSNFVSWRKIRKLNPRPMLCSNKKSSSLQSQLRSLPNLTLSRFKLLRELTQGATASLWANSRSQGRLR